MSQTSRLAENLVSLNPTYLRKLEKGASHPGLEITARYPRDGRAAARLDKRQLPIKC
jgi:hypothetical protein